MIGIFTSTDPMSDAMPFISPYAYGLNNPIRFIDPDGRMPKAASGGDPPWWSIITSKANEIYNDLKLAISRGVEPLFLSDINSGFKAAEDALQPAATAMSLVPYSAAMDNSLSTSEALGKISIDAAGSLIGGGFLDDAGKIGFKLVDDFILLHGENLITNSASYKAISKLSDSDLIQSVLKPLDGQSVKVNTKTGKVTDGNTRVYELQKRGLKVDVPYEKYTPDDSMFID